MALYLNRKSDSYLLELKSFPNERLFAKVEYIPVYQNPDLYTFQYVSFTPPKIQIKSLTVLFYDKKITSTATGKEGEIKVSLILSGEVKMTTFKIDNPIADFYYYQFSSQEEFVESFINFAYTCDNGEDLIEVCGTKHPTEYNDAISLISKISSLASLLKRYNESDYLAYKILCWLKYALLRFNVRMEKTEEKGENTAFSSLDEVLAKHGYSLFNM